MWCIPKVTEEFIKRMEDVLTLYALPRNEKEPVLCFDEKSKELHKDSHKLKQCTKKGELRKRDYEYIRNGISNIFMTVEPRKGFRSTRVTTRRTRLDFAHEIKRIVELPHYINTTMIHFVLDNLNTHNEKSLIETFGKEESDRLMKRITIHHTPKHASWLNMAEIELSVMERQCTKKRIATRHSLSKELGFWEERRNEKKEMITWKFTVDDAKKVFKYRGQN